MGPSGLATDTVGDLFVAASGNVPRVYKITPSGTKTTIGPGYFNPVGLATDAVGDVFVSDLGFGVIDKIAPNGSFTTVTRMYSVFGLAMDSKGTLFFTRRDSDTSGIIGEITPDGTVSVFATTGSGPKFLAFAPQAIPEPGTLVLSSLSLALLAGYAGWRRISLCRR